MLHFQEHLLLPLVILLLLTAITLLVYRRTTPALARLTKTFLTLLRILAILLLVLVLARPLLGINYVSKMQPEIAVLLDNSASMKLMDGNSSRAKLEDSILSTGIWKDLSRKARLEFYSFADTLRPTKPDQLDFSGSSTSLSNALLKLQKISPELSAALIITDGGNNFGPDPVISAGQLDFPIYSIGVGSEEVPADLAITDLKYPDEIYLGRPAAIELSILSTGLAEQKLSLAVSEAEKTVAQKEIRVSGGGQKIPVKFEIDPQKEGVHHYQVSLPRLEGEINYQNNLRKFSLKVQKSKLKILCLAGNLTWEYHFLKKFLEGEESFEKNYVVSDQAKPLQGIFPANLAQLSSYDLLVLVNPSLSLLSGKEQILDDYVLKQGRSILFILDNNFLVRPPARLKLQIFPFDPAKTTLSYLQFNFSFEQPAYANPILSLSEDPQENTKIWQDLPPFLGTLLVGVVNPQAKILGGFQPNDGGPLYPVLMTQEFGKGKVLTSLAFPFWRWDFLLTGVGKESQAYSKFWSNVIRWLTSQKAGKGLELATEALVYKAGEKVKFEAAYRDELGEKEAGGKLTVTLKKLSSTTQQEVAMLPNPEKEYVGSLNYLEPGDYVAEAIYSVEGKITGKVRHEFQVEEYSLEDQTLTMNRQLLTQMAEVSGGKFYTIQDYQNLPQDLDLKVKRVGKQKSWEIWNQPGMLIFALFLLSLEWFLRKRQQLP
jgi:hypothetical protein